MTVLAAVSGGPDSMALLAYLEREGIDYIVCHVNYKHRPTADRDEQIVRDWCKDHHREIRVLYPKHTGGNFEGWAREARYEFFEEVSRSEQVNVLYVGHNEDDCIETWVLQKERKTLPFYYGLKEETERNGLMIQRPLLKYTKKELELYCERANISYGIDETNLTDDYRRNQIRHSMVENADRQKRNEWLAQIRKDNDVLEARREHARVLIEQNSAEAILKDHDSWFILESYIYERTGKHQSRKSMEEAVEQLRHQGRAVGIAIDRRDGSFYLTGTKKTEECLIYNMEELKECGYVGEDGSEAEAFYIRPEDFPITIRNVKGDDVVEMRYGRKKVSKLLRDKKVPEAKRRGYCVIENKEGIVFVEGSGCSVWNYHAGQKMYFKRRNED